ncbi:MULTISPECIES: hypothetical protein [unclassified Novosphingobium]|uniref:hypothetical protein n=1 Tax=unclassified Novosphingobium TaxID=2644732 RepID=UPI000ADA3FEC|nr:MULTISPECIES: hypothetical protein [unclassified Novosphingobium]MBN9145856.1 hypothetical protein [Novosphingobium sp.]MDR6710067.1 hypothetical protein [Novosphingobium sp. 1748]
MASGNKFDATASMVGYLYQCRFALLKAIEATRDAPGADWPAAGLMDTEIRCFHQPE